MDEEETLEEVDVPVRLQVIKLIVEIIQYMNHAPITDRRYGHLRIP